MNTSQDQVLELSRQLRFAWPAFFTRFGQLNPVQIATIPAVLAGKNVVVASPTASGKTEAIVAPVAERAVTERWDGLSVLYIVPTRALANDTLIRLQGPLEEMGLSTRLKHGDHPTLPVSLPNVLITTPESLDSLICRKTQAMSNIRVVILDEIHLLDGTARGDQLRVLLNRLRRINKHQPFAVHLLSATLSNPHDVAQRYTDRFEVVTAGHNRSIEAFYVSSVEELYQLARARQVKKLLCFCNMRESVEEMATTLTELWRPYPVVAHHGSLAKRIREEAEQVMREAPVAVCVATSTLEIGIDIGSIDLIALLEPPWSVMSLLQRIGRGNRRDKCTRVALLVKTQDEQVVMENMIDITSSGALPDEPYETDTGVVVQQIFSILFQHPDGASEALVSDLLLPLCSAAECQLILLHLQATEWIEQHANKWYPTTRLMDLGDQGKIHSNIPDTQMYTVFDTDSGREVGRIAGSFDEVFLLGHRSWRVISVSGVIIKAKRFHGAASSAMFQRSRNQSPFCMHLPKELKRAT